MCMAVCADGHILIEFMLESIFLQFDPKVGARSSRQCFDLVLRNVGRASIDRLMVVHPRPLYPVGADLAEDHTQVECFAPREDFGNAPFDNAPHFDSAKGTVTLCMRRGMPEDPLGEEHAQFEARAQVPMSVAVHPAVMASHHVVGAIDSFPSVMEVTLSEPIEPGGDFHFVRIPFTDVTIKPITWKYVRSPIASNDQYDGLHQTFETLSPSALVRRLYASLVACQRDERQHDAVRESAESLNQALVHDGFWSSRRTCRVRDLRLAIVTDQRCDLAWFQPVSQIKWWHEQLVGEPAKLRSRDATARSTAHCFGAGPAWFPTEDPERVALLATQYLARIPFPPDRAGFTPEEIAVGTQVPEVYRVVSVLKLLRRLGWVDSDRHGRCWHPTSERRWGETPEDRLQLRIEMARRSKDKLDTNDPFDGDGFILYFAVAGPSTRR